MDCSISDAGRLKDSLVIRHKITTACQSEAATSIRKTVQFVLAGLIHHYFTADIHLFCPLGCGSSRDWQHPQARDDGVSLTRRRPRQMPYFYFVNTCLTEKVLLKIYLDGATHNASETFNSVLWFTCTCP